MSCVSVLGPDDPVAIDCLIDEIPAGISWTEELIEHVKCYSGLQRAED
jgi:hypothetical protein